MLKHCLVSSNRNLIPVSVPTEAHYLVKNPIFFQSDNQRLWLETLQYEVLSLHVLEHSMVKVNTTTRRAPFSVAVHVRVLGQIWYVNLI